MKLEPLTWIFFFWKTHVKESNAARHVYNGCRFGSRNFNEDAVQVDFHRDMRWKKALLFLKDVRIKIRAAEITHWSSRSWRLSMLLFFEICVDKGFVPMSNPRRATWIPPRMMPSKACLQTLFVKVIARLPVYQRDALLHPDGLVLRPSLFHPLLSISPTSINQLHTTSITNLHQHKQNGHQGVWDRMSHLPWSRHPSNARLSSESLLSV